MEPPFVTKYQPYSFWTNKFSEPNGHMICSPKKHRTWLMHSHLVGIHEMLPPSAEGISVIDAKLWLLTTAIKIIWMKLYCLAWSYVVSFDRLRAWKFGFVKAWKERESLVVPPSNHPSIEVGYTRTDRISRKQRRCLSCESGRRLSKNNFSGEVLQSYPKAVCRNDRNTQKQLFRAP